MCLLEDVNIKVRMQRSDSELYFFQIKIHTQQLKN